MLRLELLNTDDNTKFNSAVIQFEQINFFIEEFISLVEDDVKIQFNNNIENASFNKESNIETQAVLLEKLSEDLKIDTVKVKGTQVEQNNDEMVINNTH